MQKAKKLPRWEGPILCCLQISYPVIKRLYLRFSSCNTRFEHLATCIPARSDGSASGQLEQFGHHGARRRKPARNQTSHPYKILKRSEERRVGKECGSTYRSSGSPDHKKN